MRITKNLQDLKQRISDACAAAGRNENDVSILAVSKKHSVDSIRLAAEAGLHAMGENYLQEAMQKIAELDLPIEWHFIGRVQSNKTRLIAEHFAWVQTVASPKIAKRLSQQRPEDAKELNVCVQIDIDGDGGHAGIAPEGALELCQLVDELPGLRMRGLMAIPRPAETIAGQRQSFKHMKELYDDIRTHGLELDTLSMGMSGDLEAAVAEGSTMLRIGTALFGPRKDQ